MITIKQIAELAGTSRGTVDRALKGRPGINAETKERIERICREYHYAPNRAGVMLGLQKKQFRIGAVLPSLENRLSEETVAGLEEAEAQYEDFGIRIELFELGYTATEQVAAIDRLAESGISALIIAPVAGAKVEERISALRAEGVFVVTLGETTLEADANVRCPAGKIGAVAAHFAQLLGERVAFFGGCPLLPGKQEVAAEFRRALGERALVASAMCAEREEALRRQAGELAGCGADVFVADVQAAEVLAPEIGARPLIVVGTRPGMEHLLRAPRTLAVSEQGDKQAKLAVRLIVEHCINQREGETALTLSPAVKDRFCI